ncbi:MAG: cytochrome c maturation protein CcmE [Deltaproteobacteria bacterium]|nr:cytochrome c maturation protein CcmE [Deltaproteobacteria bacterium]
MNKTFLSILIASILVAGLLVFQATQANAAKVYTPDELLAHIDHDLTRIRVGGRVSKSEIKYETEPKIVLEFRILEPGSNETEIDHSKSIPVVYHGLKPDMFAGGRDVIIDGELKSGVLQASSLLTQCPSKYEPPEGPTDPISSEN